MTSRELPDRWKDRAGRKSLVFSRVFPAELERLERGMRGEQYTSRARQRSQIGSKCAVKPHTVCVFAHLEGCRRTPNCEWLGLWVLLGLPEVHFDR